MNTLKRFLKLVALVCLFPMMFIGIMLVPFTTFCALIQWVLTGTENEDLATYPVDIVNRLLNKCGLNL